MKIVQHQLAHLAILIILLFGIYSYAQTDPELLAGELFGVSTTIWFWLAIASPIVHQIYVLVCWRAELYHKSISSRFGARGFRLYKIGFAVLILSRLVTIVFLAYSNKDTLPINETLAYIIAAVLFIPAAYLFYSVKKYFGMDRAFGIDHFYPEQFLNESFIKKGIFKYTANGMYIYGFLILYVPGLLLQSKAALLAALFNHLYIWVHYYFTELPDIRKIYRQA